MDGLQTITVGIQRLWAIAAAVQVRHSHQTFLVDTCPADPRPNLTKSPATRVCLGWPRRIPETPVRFQKVSERSMSIWRCAGDSLRAAGWALSPVSLEDPVETGRCSGNMEKVKAQGLRPGQDSGRRNNLDGLSTRLGHSLAHHRPKASNDTQAPGPESHGPSGRHRWLDGVTPNPPNLREIAFPSHVCKELPSQRQFPRRHPRRPTRP